MTASLSPVQISTASKYLKGATDVTLRKRPVLGWLDKAGRINRNATGKDMNWLIKYKNDEATPYTPYENLSFSNTNYHVAASVTPERWKATSGMDISEKLENSGETQIVDIYLDRAEELTKAMEILLAKSIYLDANAAAGTGRPIGLGTIAKGSTTIACTTSDRLRAPVAGTTYAGLSIALASQGGTWSNNITTQMQMNTALGSDWPDGQGDATNAYDGTSPRLYNENTNRWATPGATAAAGTWRDNCIAMLSRANTDLRQNSMEEMMPNLHISGSQRHQDVKDKLREAFRDTMTSHAPSEMLGYYHTINFENAPIILDHECPGDRTYSVCAEAMDYQFYSAESSAEGMSGDGENITGGIYSMYGPTRPAHLLQWVWIMYAAGNSRFSPKWVVCHKDWTY